MLRIAGPGEVLGLSASLCSGPYELTAEIVDDARVAMINRKDLLQFLNDHRETCLQLAQLLSHDLHVAYKPHACDRIRAWPPPPTIAAGRS